MRYVVAMYRDPNRYSFFQDPAIFEKREDAISYCRTKSMEYGKQFFVFACVASVLYAPPPPLPKPSEFIINNYDFPEAH